MADQNSLPTPLDSHEIKYIKIISAGQKEYEVSHLLVNLDIYHDIDEPLAHGTLVLHSQKNILETIPLVGLELVRVSFSSLNDDGKSRTSYEKEFHVISIPDYILDKTNNTENVVMEIISKVAWEQQFINVSRSFPRATTSDVVRHMFQKLKHPIEIEDTLHARDLICPNLTPFQFIQKLKNISISRTRNHSDYRFFERKDKHWFKSSRTLIEANPVKDYYDGIPNFYHYDNSLLLYFKKDMHVNMAPGGPDQRKF